MTVPSAPSDVSPAAIFLIEAREEFRTLKAHADAALAQVPPTALFAGIDDASNCLGVLMKHLGGNLRSRWTDFLTTDGEKPERDRDGEFEIRDTDTPESVRALWELGWSRVLASMDALVPEDLAKAVIIRAEPMSVVRAIVRSLTHTAGHVGQIVLLAKHTQGEEWNTLSIPRRGSAEYNRRMQQRN